MPDREEVAKRLAQVHYQVEPAVSAIYAIQDNTTDGSQPDAPIRLLEVNQNTPPAGILPIQFDPAPTSGIPYAAVIVEVTPGEFERIQRKELRLPNGWVVGALIPRPVTDYPSRPDTPRP
jgi:hypothetical protein